MAKTIKTCIQYKYDTQANWQACDKDSLKGELYVHSVNDTTKLAIGDGTKKVKDLPYVVAGKPTIKIEKVPTVSGTYTYNGTTQTPAFIDYDPEQLSLEGDLSCVGAGIYTAAFTPRDGYVWADGTNGMKLVYWEIKKAKGIIKADKTYVLLCDNGNPSQDEFYITFEKGDWPGFDYTFDWPDLSNIAPGNADIIRIDEKTFLASFILGGSAEPCGTYTCRINFFGSANYEDETLDITVEYIASLNKCTWEEISAISAGGNAANYFSIGDAKKITLNGTVGTLSLDNYNTYVYIIGFDHNSSIEGTGIHFGTFKTGLKGIDVFLCNSYNGTSSDGTKRFNMNHWGNYNHGGWKGCDLRYDILGSTDIAPSGYGSKATSGRTGYDATATCAISPVSGTLMAALPADLRAVMKPMIKYSDNKGGVGNISTYISSSIDYLPLLAEAEVADRRINANSYEQNYLQRYEYFTLGNLSTKYYHTSTSTKGYFWLRSVYYSTDQAFCLSGNGFYKDSAYYSYGLAPIFKV